MIRWEGAYLGRRLPVVDVASFFSFCLSVPLLLPVLELWQSMTVPSAPDAGSFLPAVPFATALSLASMFTALAFLFVCLLKTGYIGVSATVALPAFVSYVSGYVLLNLWSAELLVGPVVEVACGLMLGFGAAVICLMWMTRLRIPEFRGALAVVCIAACCQCGGSIVLSLLGADIARNVLMVAALLSSVGNLRLFLRPADGAERSAVGSNWWDVFGHLDVSIVDGTDDFRAPLARVLFFVVMPLAVLLLFVTDSGLSRDIELGVMPHALSGVLAVVAMVPLARLKTDQALINFSSRFLLPLITFAVFAATAFVDAPFQRMVMVVGSLSFCSVYAMIMLAMLVTMAGRMRSLALPSAGMMIVAGCLVCLLSTASVEPGVLDPYRYRILLVLFVITAAVLMLMPSTRLWRMVLEGIDAIGASAGSAQDPYASRCVELAETYGLTVREREILLLLGRGHSARFVAEELTVAESTARSHRKNIYRKLGIASREELFALLDAQGAGGT